MQQVGTIGHAVDRALTALAVHHHDLAVAGEAEAATALVGDRRDVAVVDRAIADRFEMRGFVDLSSAADVERAHGQLGAWLADRLSSDHTHGFAVVD